MCNDLPEEFQCISADGKTRVPSRAVVKSESEGCITLSQSGKNVRMDHFILDKKENNGIKIHFQGQEMCDKIHDYDLTVDIKCDPNAE